MLHILFLGDVVGKSGRQAVIHLLPMLREQYEADFVIVNGENAAHGKGITKEMARRIHEAGADVITLGNHAFAKNTFLQGIEVCPYVVRPANLYPTIPGRSVVLAECCGKTIAVLNLLGEAFMTGTTGSPIPAFEKMISGIDADIKILDFHAEATAEKRLFFEYFKGSLTAVIGTHTHVQTADEIVRNGCAFITDVGMCGPEDSVLGRDTDEVIDHVIKGKHTIYKPASGPSVINGCVIDIDEKSCRAIAIRRVRIKD